MLIAKIQVSQLSFIKSLLYIYHIDSEVYKNTLREYNEEILRNCSNLKNNKEIILIWNGIPYEYVSILLFNL